MNIFFRYICGVKKHHESHEEKEEIRLLKEIERNEINEIERLEKLERQTKEILKELPKKEKANLKFTAKINQTTMSFVTSISLPVNQSGTITVQVDGVAADGVTIVPISKVAFASSDTSIFGFTQHTDNPQQVDLSIVGVGTGALAATATFADGTSGSGTLSVTFNAATGTATLGFTLISPTPTV